MTARPVYRKFAAYGPAGGHLGHRTWEVTDGIGGPVLASGWAFTRRGAGRAASAAAGRCEEAIESRLGRLRDRFARDGLRLDVSVDDRGRVCVRPRCVCSDRDHRRVLLAFCRVVGPVLWVRPETEVQALSARATGSGTAAAPTGGNR